MNQPSETDLRRAAAIFKVLGHPERIRVAARLAESGPHTQHGLLQEVPWAPSTLARHVGLMREQGLILATRRGNTVHLRLADELVPHLLELITTTRSVGGVPAPAAPAGGATT